MQPFIPWRIRGQARSGSQAPSLPSTPSLGTPLAPEIDGTRHAGPTLTDTDTHRHCDAETCKALLTQLTPETLHTRPLCFPSPPLGLGVSTQLLSQTAA